MGKKIEKNEKMNKTKNEKYDNDSMASSIFKADFDSIYDNWQYTRLNNDNISIYEKGNFDWKQYISNYNLFLKIIQA